MRDTLLLPLRNPDPDGRLPYVLGAADGSGALTLERGEPEQVLAEAARRRLVLLAPATDVRLASITVPARQAQKVLQAAPYALEDQLAEDVDTLHFAIGQRQADGSHPVAVVSRERMDGWLAPLRERGLQPEALLPETLCLPPPQPGQWIGVVENPGSGPLRVVVRTAAYAGLTCSADDLAGYLRMADPDSRVRLTLYVTDGVDHDFTGIGRPLELLPGHRSALEVLARHRTEANIDLLQGAYSHSQGWAAHLAPWKVAATLAAVWAGLAVTGEAVQAWQLGRELAAQEEQNLARFKTLYPAETRIVDLAAQTEQKLAALRGGGHRAPWFESLDLMTSALQANPGLSLRSVQFREGALYLDLSGSDLQSWESMRQWFGNRRDAQISDVQANSGTDGVRVRFKLTLA